jgi:hypothetical protein
MTNNKKETMKEEWQKVRESFYYPQIPVPKFADDIPNACIDFSDLQIKVNPAYIDKLVQKGVNEHITLNAILGHEVGHFVDYPGSVLDLLRLHKVARESMNEKDAYTLREIFLNVQNNTNLVINRNYETIPPAIKPEVVESEGIGRVIYGLYQDLWKKDLGVNLKRSEKDLVSRLTGINYLNKGMQEQSLKKFINILGDYVKQENQKKSKDNNNKKGGGKGEKEDEGQSQESCLKGFSENQIREGIRQFAKESNPGEFEQIVGEILKEIEDKNQKGGPRSMEHQPYHKQGAGTEKGNIILARNIYSALAENFSIPIRKKQIKKNGSLYPHSHEEFGMSDSINE